MAPPPEPAGDRSPVRSLDDRLAFRRAQAVLTGLTGCRLTDAARSLRSAAVRLDRAVPEVARLFLDALERRDDEQAVSLLLLLAGGACPPERAETPEGGASSDGAGAVEPRALEPRALELGALELGALAAAARQVAAADADVRVAPPDTAEARELIARAVRMRWLPPAGGGHLRLAVQPPTAALDELYDRCAGSCLAVARHLLGDDDRAEDVVQATFLDAWEHLAAGSPLPAPADRWLWRRTHLRAVTRLRAERSRPPVEPPPHPAGGDRLSGLPADQRRAVQWAVWGGCTAQDIALLTGTPLREVRASLLAGMRALGRAAGRTGHGPTGQPG